MSENELRRILQAHSPAQLEEYPAPHSKVQICQWEYGTSTKTSPSSVLYWEKSFEETFKNLPTMGYIPIGMSFFKKYSVALDFANNIVRFPEITLQLKPPTRNFAESWNKLTRLIQFTKYNLILKL